MAESRYNLTKNEKNVLLRFLKRASEKATAWSYSLPVGQTARVLYEDICLIEMLVRRIAWLEKREENRRTSES
jgi:hypothetical protein